MQEKTLIIIPTYNEIDNIDVILGAIFASAPKVNVLFVDDNSPDGTGDWIDKHCAANPQVHVLHR
ncbi:MAG: glycosyltransferase, partial [Kiritimatiellae bacterium]|nr:glycosyltransferase [Kiritimatiellia bacterium]